MRHHLLYPLSFSQYPTFRLALGCFLLRSAHTAYHHILSHKYCLPLRSSLWMQGSKWHPTFCGDKHFHWHPGHCRASYCSCDHRQLRPLSLFTPKWLLLVYSTPHSTRYRRPHLPYYPLGKKEITNAIRQKNHLLLKRLIFITHFAILSKYLRNHLFLLRIDNGFFVVKKNAYKRYKCLWRVSLRSLSLIINKSSPYLYTDLFELFNSYRLIAFVKI